MASTIEPCESKPAGLATLSSTLDMFDTFKPSQDEDRDSDEESFHLPMLGCDDDLDLSNKETSGIATPNPETEDDILNKFETTATPDIDPKLEDIILDDDNDETCENGSTKIVEISKKVENKDRENSTVSKECVGQMKVDENETGTDVNEKTTETGRITDETVETKFASETDENTDGSEVFKDLEIVDELDESFEEKGDENINNDVSDTGKKPIIEIDNEPESMEVDTAEEESFIENVQDIVETGETQKNVICHIEETEDTSISKTKLDESDKTANATEMALADKNVGNSCSEIIMPCNDLSGTDKSTLDAMIDENILPKNISYIKNTQEENRVENSSEESKMTCDDEEDEIINYIVKEVNEKLDSDEDEMMAESSVLQESSTKSIPSINMSVGNGNNDKVEDCAELEEINSSSCSNTADNNVVEKQDNAIQKSLDQGENVQDSEMSEMEAFVPICKPSKTILAGADDSREADENTGMSDKNYDANPMDIDISMDEGDNISVPKSKKQENASEENSERRIIELSTSAKIVENTSTAELVKSAHAAEIVERTPIAEIVESTPTAEIVENCPTAEISESTPSAEIKECTPTADIVESTPTAEIVKSTSTTEIVKSTPTADIVESTPTAKIVKNMPTADIVKSMPTAEIAESTPNSEIVESTPTSEIVDNQLITQTECIESVPPIKSLLSKANEDEKTDTSKMEKSYESTNSLECDDLLDVSIIRDVDEDNATAIAENSNDIQSSEKSDNDEPDDDKADNEMDESELDQDDILLSSDKDDHIDSEEGNSNSCDQDTMTADNLMMSENTSDGETKGDDDVVMKETEEPKKNNSSTRRMEAEFESTSETSEPMEKSVETENQEKIKENGVQLGKRPFTETSSEENTSKKLRLSPESNFEEKGKMFVKNSQMKTLLSFEKFMQDRKFGSKKLTRSDLEQFCLQKICEAIVHKTDVGELHQTVKKQEIIIENLRKDLQQLSKQTRDLDIVNKKLMNELKMQNGNKKPLVPLKITRSVGLQVKLNIGLEPAARRKQPIVSTTPSRTPSTSSTNTPVNRSRNITPANSGVVRQVNQNSTPVTTTTPSPRKSQPTTPILSQALQTRQTPPLAKRTPIRPKPAEPAKPANPGVIDLTDEDDKTSKTAGTAMKIPNKPIAPKTNLVQNKNLANKTVNSQANKIAGQASKVAGQASKVAGQNIKAMNKANKSLNNQNKPVTMSQVKAVGPKTGTQTRTVATLPQGVRLTSTQLKNGLTIPANVVTSNASGTTQFMYVVQPSSLVTSTAGGTQKTVLLNFQPTSNGVLASTINGSAVSVIPSKTPNTVQLKSITTPRKHPASLPLPPSVPQNPSLKPLLPKPHLSIRKTDTGIILQWRMPYNLDIYEGIASYQLFAYQETNAPPSTDMWRKVGDVKALALPMACTLTQFADKNKYYFAVRSVDVHKRIGAFSDPEEISL